MSMFIKFSYTQQRSSRYWEYSSAFITSREVYMKVFKCIYKFNWGKILRYNWFVI